MKKTSIFYTLPLALALLAPSVSLAQSNLQAKPLFPFFSNEKAGPVTPAPAQPAQTAIPTELTEDTLDLAALKLQPLPIRRKIVASELDTILLRLNVLYDKTKMTTDRLGENDIDVSLTQTELATAAKTLLDARTTIDALALVANDPANESVIVLMVGEMTFKEAVVKAEGELRAARTSIITALSTLKTAVTTSITSPAN